MNRRLSIPLLAALLAASCSDGVDVPFDPVRLVYSPSEGRIPLPNDVLFKDTIDVTLNLPPGAPSQQVLFDALNSLDGWSTSAPITFSFDHGVDASTVAAGTTVRFFEVTLSVAASGVTAGQPVTGVTRELVPGTEYVVAASPSDSSGATFAIVPTQPLEAKTSYMVVVTNGVRDNAGNRVAKSAEYGLAAVTDAYVPSHPLAGLQVLVNAMETAASTDTDVSPLVNRSNIVVSFTFTTQSLYDALLTTRLVSQGLEAAVLTGMCNAAPAMVHAACMAAPANTVPSGTLGAFINSTDVLVPGSPGLADIYDGSLTLPYYLEAAPNAGGGLVEDEEGPRTGRWTARFSFLEGSVVDPSDADNHITRYNTLPLETGAEVVPVLISLPNVGVQPAAGWPVVIFQHGITSERTAMLALADTLAGAGFACVAIDLPLHGIVDTGNLFHTSFMDGGLRERTFGLDLVTEVSGVIVADEPDMVVDGSGAHFINLTSPQTQRDNLRQAVADLFAVVKMIQDNMDVDGLSNPAADDFDPARIHFVGMSLGSIVGTTFLAVDQASGTPVIKSGVLNVPGGGIPRFLVESATFGPAILAGLAVAGLEPGTASYDSYLFAMQSTIDSGDPINFAPLLAGSALPILAQKVVGGASANYLPDQVIPNAVSGAPLSGTNPLLTNLGLTTVDATTTADKLAVGFSKGTHSSLLVPDRDGLMDAGNLATFLEMQAQLGAWLGVVETTPALTVTDPTVIDDVP